MTNEELKKKIVEILDNNIRWQPYYYISRGIVYEDDLKNIADALIAAGIGDVKDAEAEANRYEMLYQMQSRDMALAERKAYESEHRAEVAERALELMARGECTFASPEYYKKQADKELAEERKDD